jgi:hypothetical protein
MRLILSLLLVAASAWGQGYFRSPWQPTNILTNDTSGSTFNLDAITDWFGFRFTQSSTKTLNKIRVNASAVTGSLNAGDLHAEVVKVVPSWVPTATVTYTDASDIVNYTAHPFVNGDTVRFTAASGLATDVPDGIDINTTYYVCNKNTNDFQIDDSAGCGSVVTDFSGSTGTQAVRNTLAVSTTVTSVPTGAAVVEFTGFSQSLTINNTYVILFYNKNGTPGSNYVQYKAWGMPQTACGGYFGTISSTSGLTTTAAQKVCGTGVVLEYSDGSVYGSMVTSSTTQSVYDTAAAGARYSAFPVALNIIGACAELATAGTTATQYEYLAGTSPSFSRNTIFGNNNQTCMFFSTAVAVPANTPFRLIVAASTAGDTSGNRVNLWYYGIPDTANDKALAWNGTHKATCTLPCNAGGWTYTTTHVALVSPILQDGSEASAAAGARSFPIVN